MAASNMRNADSLPGLSASSDLSAKQYYAVKFSGDMTVTIAGDGDATGVLQNAPTSGKAADVCASGIFMAILGGTVVAGARLTSDANGKLVSMTVDVTPTTFKNQVGFALKGGDANERIPVQGTPGAFIPV